MAINVGRYKVSSKTLVGRITPFFLRGNKLTQLLAAICSPLDSVNNAFVKWVRETIINAATTSQVIVLKWSLENRLVKYIKGSGGGFVFDTYAIEGYTTLYEDNAEQLDYPEIKNIYMPEDPNDHSCDTVDTIVIRDKEEIESEENEIVIIAPPHNEKISDEQYIKKIKQCVEPYLVYDIKYNIVISKQ